MRRHPARFGASARLQAAVAAVALAVLLVLAPPAASVGWAQEAVPDRTYATDLDRAQEAEPDRDTAPGPARVSEPDGRPISVDLSGYVRSLTGYHDAGFDLPGVDRTTLFNSEVGRLMWTGRWGERVSFVAHNRLVARVSFTGAGFGSEVAGLGVSVVPSRSLDLGTTLLEDDHLRLTHDVDRLAVTVRTRAADVTVGRQAITWGLASLFPTADLWAQFSPFELDTDEKPGIDALRVLAYPRDGVELDMVLADRGSWRHLSGGARATFELASADAYAGAGKFWDRLMVLGGVAYMLDRTTLRAEAALPWSLDDRRLERPRATLGVDRLGTRLTLSAEYHHNGIGARDVGGYAAALGDPRIRRGETYFLGRHYLGGLAAWTPDADGRLNVALSALANLRDRSVALSPAVHYDLGQNLRLSAGAMQGVGRRPGDMGAVRSEFGSYGRVWFVGGAAFFGPTSVVRAPGTPSR